ncbi:hypothetical protein [Tsukamurella sputi]|uniref:hypothetical protein n=1 Tax=Tsukamurella sputi TaxID=2591848 RepID=UPI001878E0EE|nr:hypothetical protein [Tsukamurella sputi]
MAEVSELWSLIQSHLDQYGVTDAEFARRMGVSPQTLNSWKKRGVRKLPDRDKLESVSELTRNTYAHVLDAALVDSGYKDELRDELVEIGQRIRDLDDPGSWDALRDLVAELLDAYYLEAAERRPKLSELIGSGPRRKAAAPATTEGAQDQASPGEKTRRLTTSGSGLRIQHRQLARARELVAAITGPHPAAATPAPRPVPAEPNPADLDPASARAALKLIDQLKIHHSTVAAASDGARQAADDIIDAARSGADDETLLEAVHRFQREFSTVIAGQGSAIDTLDELLALLPLRFAEQIEPTPVDAIETFGKFIREVLLSGNENTEAAGPLIVLADSSDRLARRAEQWNATVSDRIDELRNPRPAAAREVGQRLRTTRTRDTTASEAASSKRDTQSRHERIDITVPSEVVYAPAHWPDGVEVATTEKAQWAAWLDAGEPEDFETYRQGDYELAARDLGDEPVGRKIRRRQDEAGELPDPEGPEGGA